MARNKTKSKSYGTSDIGSSRVGICVLILLFSIFLWRHTIPHFVNCKYIYINGNEACEIKMYCS